MIDNTNIFITALAFTLLTGCGNGEPGGPPESGGDNGAAAQTQSVSSTEPAVNAKSLAENTPSNEHNDAGGGGKKCAVRATWTGDFDGSVDWAPEKAPANPGFTVDYKSFAIETSLFNLTAEFETPFENGKTGTFEGKATYFYVTDAPYEGPQGIDGKVNIAFPMDGDRVAQGVPVTLEITEWQTKRISGSVSAGPFTGVASGPSAPKDGGPDGPLKPITVSGSAQFHASGEITDALVGRTQCHKPYIR